jgi:hypothetical protein
MCATLCRSKDEEVANLHSRRRRVPSAKKIDVTDWDYILLEERRTIFSPRFMAFDLKIQFQVM